MARAATAESGSERATGETWTQNHQLQGQQQQ